MTIDIAVPDPGEYTVDEVKDKVREADYSPQQLHAIEQYERDNKDRVTLTEWLADRHDYDPDAVEVDDEPADPADAAPARQGPSREADHPTLGDDDYDPAKHNAWAPGEVPTATDIPLVVVAPPGEGMYAGYWFERERPKVVKRTRRVDDAIVDGPLDYRGPPPEGAVDGETL